MSTRGKSEPQPRHRLLVATTALLAISYVPLELGLGTVSTAPVIAALSLILMVRYRAFDGGVLSPVEVVTLVWGIWIAARLLLIAPLSGETLDAGFAVRELGVLLVGIGLFRLARRPELKASFVKGLFVALALLLALEAYQVMAGLGPLVSVGYVPENGYNFATRAGDYRPFGTFAGPTTFGTFLAMVGIFVTSTVRRTGLRVVLGVTVAVGVLLTDTRAAYLGVGIALLLLIAMSPAARPKAVVVAVPGVLAAALAIILVPTPFVSAWNRILSVQDASETSRQTRLGIWEGVMRAVSSQGHMIDGFGATDWAYAMSSQLGSARLLGHAHSNFFQELFRYGYVGAALFTVFVLAVLHSSVRAARLRTTPLSAAAMMGVVVFAVDSVFNNSLSCTNFVVAFLVLAGLGQLPVGSDGGAGGVAPDGAVRPDRLAQGRVVEHRTSADRRGARA